MKNTRQTRLCRVNSRRVLYAECYTLQSLCRVCLRLCWVSGALGKVEKSGSELCLVSSQWWAALHFNEWRVALHIWVYSWLMASWYLLHTDGTSSLQHPHCSSQLSSLYIHTHKEWHHVGNTEKVHRSYCWYIYSLRKQKKNKSWVFYQDDCGRSGPKCLAPCHAHSKHLQST